mgnify:CR=1 FL=1
MNLVTKLAVIVAAIVIVAVAIPHFAVVRDQRAQIISRDQRVNRLVAIGDDAASVDDLALATAAYNRALALAPGLDAVRTKQSQLMARSILDTPVVESAEQKLALQLQLSDALMAGQSSGAGAIRVAYAKILLDRGFADIAATHFQEVLKVDAKNADAHLYMGDTFLRKKEWTNARNAIQKAIELRPKHGLSHYAMGQAYSGLENWKEAANHLEQAVAAKPNGSMYADLGRVRMAQNKSDLAEKAFAKARSLGVSSLSIMVGHGEALRLNGRAEEALAVYATAYKQAPTAAILGRIGQLQIKLKDFKSALTTYSTLRKRQKGNPEPACRLGFVYRQLGAVEQAINAYQWCQRKSAGIEAYQSLQKLAVTELEKLAQAVKSAK